KSRFFYTLLYNFSIHLCLYVLFPLVIYYLCKVILYTHNILPPHIFPVITITAIIDAGIHNPVTTCLTKFSHLPPVLGSNGTNIFPKTGIFLTFEITPIGVIRIKNILTPLFVSISANK